MRACDVISAFETSGHLEGAVRDLTAAGFDTSRLSLVAYRRLPQSVAGLLGHVQLVRTATGPTIAATGRAAVAMAAAALTSSDGHGNGDAHENGNGHGNGNGRPNGNGGNGNGRVRGNESILARWVSDDVARRLHSLLEEGRLVLWAQLDVDSAKRAADILSSRLGAEVFTGTSQYRPTTPLPLPEDESLQSQQDQG